MPRRSVADRCVSAVDDVPRAAQSIPPLEPSAADQLLGRVGEAGLAVSERFRRRPSLDADV